MNFKRFCDLIKETTGTGDIRGLGNVTGNPATDENQHQDYIDRNLADADTQNDILNKNLEKIGLKRNITAPRKK